MRDEVDIAIVGGGLAGSCLAFVVTAKGLRVALCDPHDTYPPDFRAEKLSPRQARLLERLGLWERVREIVTPINELSVARFGHVVERSPSEEYGVDYTDLVNTIRANVPSALNVGRVARIEASTHLQKVVFRDGREIRAKLVVVATGLGKGLLSGLGIQRIIVQNDHCLAIGFDLALADAARQTTGALTYHGERPVDRSAYLTLFPIADRLRANLFAYRRYDEDWSKTFCQRPRRELLAIMPKLASLIGPFEIGSAPVLRPIDLYESDGYRRDGVVMIGDAFSTTCPAAGSGVDKVLTDVDTLAGLLPGWLATEGMGRDKIEQFYADPAKIACDGAARRRIAYAKAMAVNPGLTWTARRYRNFYAQKVRYWLRRRLGDHPDLAKSAWSR